MTYSELPEEFKAADKLIIIEPSGHYDWDWIVDFKTYYDGKSSPHSTVRNNLDHAINLLTNDVDYTFSICEMAYLQAYLNDEPNQASVIEGFGDRFSISGGGMTSAENLLCHGETFIRNYLAGRLFALNAIKVSDVPSLWIPDDFGQDAQLPIVLRAMGYEGAAFWRIPGSNEKSGINYRKSTSPGAVLDRNIDFSFQAADGSAVQAHWIWKGYCEGNNIYVGPSVPPNYSMIDTIILDYASASPAPYMFVTIDCDFNDPNQFSGIVQNVKDWNTNKAPSANIYALVAPFNFYQNLVKTYAQSNPLKVFSGPLNPYYSGCYATHPDLKLLHYSATRLLLACETFERVGALNITHGWDEGAKTRQEIEDTWNLLIPSSHHDYITGTAVDSPPYVPVYSGEQLPRLFDSLTAAVNIRNKLMDNITSKLTYTTEGPMAVFNPLSMQRTNEVVFPPDVVYPPEMPSPIKQTQSASVNQALFTASVPGMGYNTVVPGPSNLNPVQLTYSPGGGYSLTNSLLTAYFDTDGNLTFLRDETTKKNVLKDNEIGNKIVFYEDSGNMYRFGNEILMDETSPLQPMVFKPAAHATTLDSIMMDTGDPLFMSLNVATTYSFNKSNPVTYQTKYSMVAGEPLLRMTLVGAAPESYTDEKGVTIGFSVMACFPLFSEIATLTHGTAYHWDENSPRDFYDSTAWNKNQDKITFEATHGFILPKNSDSITLAGIYHASTPAWGIDPHGALIGCVLRNAHGSIGNAAARQGIDTEVHTVSYALRIPSGLDAADTSHPLQESLRYNNPLVGIPVPSTADDSAPASASLASSLTSNAVITAAKAGSIDPTKLILRVYQPTNSPLKVDVLLSSIIRTFKYSVASTNALELATDPNTSVTVNNNGISVDTNYALSTAAISITPEQ